MSELETLMIQVGVDFQAFEEGIQGIKKNVKGFDENLDKIFKDFPALKGYAKDGKLAIGENFQENLV